MRSLSDTIVAPITGTHPAPVAIVRVSGPEAWRIVGEVFENWPEVPEPRKAVYGKICGAEEGFALPFPEGKSYTGEQTVEFSIHGSPASVRRVVEACRKCGARLAEPGEFTQRAFLNGRIDLTQAEGVRDTIQSRTDAQLRQAALHREGVLNKQIEVIRSDIASVLAAVEASVDFSEEVGELNRENATERLSCARSKLQSLLETAAAGRLLREGIRVVIAGKPNAGKSSIFNAVLGSDRAIVTEIPGTTRDYVEEQVERNGLLWVFVDTAGLRESEDKVEKIGVERARSRLETADAVWWVYDAALGWSNEDVAGSNAIDSPTTVLANKSDLAPHPAKGIPTSALTGEGLADAFEQTVRALNIDALGERVLLNSRHGPLVERALFALNASLDALNQEVPDDLVAVGLYDAHRVLGEITGDTASEDLLENIFRDFCIGK